MKWLEIKFKVRNGKRSLERGVEVKFMVGFVGYIKEFISYFNSNREL